MRTLICIKVAAITMNSPRLPDRGSHEMQIFEELFVMVEIGML